jgi:hypothetical protein
VRRKLCLRLPPSYRDGRRNARKDGSHVHVSRPIPIPSVGAFRGASCQRSSPLARSLPRGAPLRSPRLLCPGTSGLVDSAVVPLPRRAL